MQLGECADGVTAVRCVRAVRSAAELVRVRSKCVTPPTLQATTARPRPRLAAPAQRPIGTPNATSPCVNSVIAPTWFGRPLQAVAVEHVGNNSLQHTSYGMGFPRVKAANLQRKPAIGGGGGSTWIYDGDDDALPPSDFFSPTGPLRACPSRSPCSTLFTAACAHVVPLGAIDTFLWGDVSSGRPG